MLPFIQLLQHRTARPLVRFAHLCVRTIAAAPRTIYDHEFIFVLKGSGIVSSEGKQAAYKEGSVIMFPPGVAHSLTQEQEEELHIAIHFDWEQVQPHEELRHFIDNEASDAEAESAASESAPVPAATASTSSPGSIWLPHVTVLESASDELFACAGWTLRAYEQGGAYQRLRTDAEMLNLIVQLVQNITEGPQAIQSLHSYENQQAAAQQESSDMVAFAQRMEQLAEELPISAAAFEELCRESYFSESHFRRLFEEQMGMEPHPYFTSLRLRRASQLLLDTERPIQEISYLCGYEDAKYFSRLFRQHEGMTPQEFRQSLRNAVRDL
ncbi:AraC-type DNA-binding protein [Paenibacillus algorifonticola]|uniref:AraC-type DNA-binding protein n=1 Tax=Paenibacillus algorifonticola TaxID=684063 RepID=A0A1I2HYZ9_9BACL|nr:AraC family transcriptional regulator [Paenibacillus algorifonticola]SFF33581.1 AraC-type DNA-binding protein [Paenibacillus algorifonticola]